MSNERRERLERELFRRCLRFEDGGMSYDGDDALYGSAVDWIIKLQDALREFYLELLAYDGIRRTALERFELDPDYGLTNGGGEEE